MMPGDSVEHARQEVEAFGDQPVVHAWDQDRRLGDLFAKTIKLTSTAWDAYFLYASGIRWEDDAPPKPTFWMHQLGTSTGASSDLVLNPGRLLRELATLLGDGFEPSGEDLALILHAKGLDCLTRERALGG